MAVKAYALMIFCISISQILGCALLSNKIDVKFDEKYFSVPKKYQDLLSPQQTRLKIYSNLDFEDAKGKIIELIKIQKQYFVPNIEPYSGKNSLPEKCRLNNLPKILQGEDKVELYSQLSLFSSVYFQLGCGTHEPVLMQSLFLYCKKEKVLYSFFTLLVGYKDWLNEPMAHCHLD